MKPFGNLKKFLNYAQEKTEITDKIRKSYGLAVSFENIPIAQQVKWLNALEISLKELNIFFNGRKQLLNPSGKMRIIFTPKKKNDPSALGEYFADKDAIYMYGENPQIFAHELFHAIDYQAGHSIGLPSNALLSDYIFILSRAHKKEVLSFADELSDMFVEESMTTINEQFNSIMHRSMNCDDVYSCKKRYNCLPCEIMARTFEACVAYKLEKKVKNEYHLLYSYDNIYYHHNEEENRRIDRFPTEEELEYFVPLINGIIRNVANLNIQKEHDYFEDIEEMNEYFEKHNYPLAVGYSPVHVKHVIGRNKDGSLKYIEGEKDDLEMF